MANGQINMTRLITLTPPKTPHREDTREKVPHIDPLGRRSKMNTRDKRDEGQVLLYRASPTCQVSWSQTSQR